MARSEKTKALAEFIWEVADLLRGDYKQADYGKVIFATDRFAPVGLRVRANEGQRMDENQDIFAKILDNAELGAVVWEWMLRKVYARLTEP